MKNNSWAKGRVLRAKGKFRGEKGKGVKKRTTDLYQKVMNGEVKVEDLELADIIRIQILLDS